MAPDKVFQFRHDQAVPVRVVWKRLARASVRRRAASSSNQTAAPRSFWWRVRRRRPLCRSRTACWPERIRRGAWRTRRGSPPCHGADFENGAVAAWYATNGWTYPVQGPPASGIAALQQFYEAVGLVALLRVELDRPVIRLQSAGPSVRNCCCRRANLPAPCRFCACGDGRAVAQDRSSRPRRSYRSHSRASAVRARPAWWKCCAAAFR